MGLHVQYSEDLGVKWDSGEAFRLLNVLARKNGKLLCLKCKGAFLLVFDRGEERGFKCEGCGLEVWGEVPKPKTEKRKYRKLSIEQRVWLLNDIVHGSMNHTEIARKHGVPRSMVRGYMKKSETWMRSYTDGKLEVEVVEEAFKNT